jgi:hypothetical protein
MNALSSSLFLGFYASAAGTKVLDARGDNCGIVIEQGTSFSAPILAGSAAIIRQYFMDGWYPKGSPSPEDAFTPSGSLIKAILVTSGRPLRYISDGVTSTKTTWTDNNQGYGRVQLNTVLSFLRPSTLNGLTLFVKGAADPSSPHYAELSSGSAPHRYKFTTQNIKDLSPIKVS